jgi:flagellar basal body P-ring protein FlgI
MKFVQYFSMLALVALVISGDLLAKDSHSGTFTTTEKVKVGSTTLPPGDYKVEWSGSPDNAKVEIMNHGKTVVSSDATIKTLPQPSPYTAVITRTLRDNTKQVNEIEFDHHSEALVLPGE